MDIIQLTGFAAAFCTTFAFLPQVLHIWKNKSAEGVSLVMYSILLTGLFLWTLYGIAQSDLPLIVANIITFTLALMVVILKLIVCRK
jgi:MtN3 and saliva related transmembrane protein